MVEHPGRGGKCAGGGIVRGTGSTWPPKPPSASSSTTSAGSPGSAPRRRCPRPTLESPPRCPDRRDDDAACHNGPAPATRSAAPHPYDGLADGHEVAAV